MSESELDELMGEVGGPCNVMGMVNMFQEKLAGAGVGGTRISQNCVGSACSQTNFGRRKREVVAKLLEEAHKVAEEQAEAEALETQSRKKRSFTHLLP